MLTLLYACMQLLKAVLTLCLVLLSASMFGAGVQREAWVIGWGAQMWLFKLFFTPLNETFRARFLQLRNEQGAAFALASTRSLLLFVSIVAIASVIFIVCCSGTFMQFIAPGYFRRADQEQIRLMTLYLAPVLLISEWTSLLTALLNCYRSFYLPELLSLFTIVLNILLLWIAGDLLGVYAFVWANYISLILLLLLLLRQVARLGLFDKTPPVAQHVSVKPFLLFTAPLYGSALAAQFNVWSERRMLSYLRMGSNAALDYARKFTDAPVILIVSLATAVVAPLLSTLLSRSGITGKAFKKECYLFMRSCLLVLAPVIFVCTYGAPELVSSFLLHGKFEQYWAPDLISALQWFAAGLPGTVLCVIMGQVLLLQKRSGIYAAIAAVSQLLPVVANYYLFREKGIPVFACTWSVAQYIMGFSLLIAAGLSERKLLLRLLSVALLCICSALAAAAVTTLARIESPVFRLAFMAFSHSLLILSALFLLRFEEAGVLKLLLRKVRIRSGK
ncbi:lipid II flippase MurJ [Rurimicrobium arvi]|uniref:Uncharacterized protein n=1 Tax=Rurimicrobium arvi TaxID=2049916 RepID=A0ABP8MSM1_9BACT